MRCERGQGRGGGWEDNQVADVGVWLPSQQPWGVVDVGIRLCECVICTRRAARTEGAAAGLVVLRDLVKAEIARGGRGMYVTMCVVYADRRGRAQGKPRLVWGAAAPGARLGSRLAASTGGVGAAIALASSGTSSALRHATKPSWGWGGVGGGDDTTCACEGTALLRQHLFACVSFTRASKKPPHMPCCPAPPPPPRTDTHRSGARRSARRGRRSV